VRRLVGTLVVLALVVAALGAAIVAYDAGRGAGRSSSPLDAPSTTPEPSATVPPEPGLTRFYDQHLDWQQCRDQFACARLTVPLDYRHPGGRTIELAVLKRPASDPGHRLGSLVVNPGGPGASGIDYAAAAEQAFRRPLLDAYDIVGFDPRGVGASTAVDCLSDARLDGYLAADPTPDTPAEERAFLAQEQAIGRGCLDHSGRLAAHVTTIEAARDMDVLRAALGESTLDYLGASYGTELGATYAELFPHRVGRMVLDGAVDLRLSGRQLALQQARGFETALRAYVQNCVDETDSCFLGSSVEAGLQRIQQFLAQVDRQPLPTSSNRRLTIGNAFYGVVLPLYDRDYWYLLSAGLKQGFAGDGTMLLQLADAYASRGPSGYVGNTVEANYAISCLDDPASVPAADVAAQEPAFEKASPTFGDVFAWGLTSCSGLRVRSGEKPLHVDGAGAPPIVVVGTTRDPATPLAWAEDLADQLDSGVLVTRDGDGHTGYNTGNSCVDTAVEGYLLRGDVPRDGLAC
jgi:pimeloyl-ACP methyl ester carboxylesterase